MFIEPIAGSVGEIDNVSQIEDITIDDSDLSTLKEFLGPEVMLFFLLINFILYTTHKLGIINSVLGFYFI